MEITGRIIERDEIEVISDKFSKRQIVIETDGNDEGKYKQVIAIEFINKAIEKLEGFPVGSHVVVSIEIRGRKWQRTPQDKPRYFTNISGWRIGSSSAGGDNYPASGGGGGGGGQGGGGGGFGPPGSDDDEIPFGPNFYV